MIEGYLSPRRRSEAGGAVRTRLRGYLVTVRKQGHALLTTLETLFAAQLFYPAFA